MRRVKIAASCPSRLRPVVFDLFGQLLFPLNHQVRIRMRGASSRLPSTDCNQVIAGREHAISRFIHIAEVARTECQLHMLLFARFQMECG